MKRFDRRYGLCRLTACVEFVRGGVSVLGLDIDQSKVDALTNGTSYLGHIADNDIALAATGRFEATTDFAAVAGMLSSSQCPRHNQISRSRSELCDLDLRTHRPI